MSASGPTHRSSPQYVSPSLGPTNPWAQEISTGTFRPPNPSSFSVHHEVSGATSFDMSSRYSFSSSYAPCVYLFDHPESGTHETQQDSDFKIQKVMNMIISAIGQEHDAFAIQKESNRVLEQELRQIQRRREETERQLREIGSLSNSLEKFQKEQLQLLEEFKSQ
ncbi:hypothetical protein LSM04_007364 [Trypanosoma melophagium]|uniref:uncharacterized protein n=1 Tax=Trypanosoma melophagium TaxID=715481 RepID=UPI00351A8E38|nr:hypothetical protein LSM04_007364 [Trypanosoma melophagium]